MMLTNEIWLLTFGSTRHPNRVTIHQAEEERGYAEGGLGGQGGPRTAVQGSPGPRVSPGQAMLSQRHGSEVL